MKKFNECDTVGHFEDCNGESQTVVFGDLHCGFLKVFTDEIDLLKEKIRKRNLMIKQLRHQLKNAETWIHDNGEEIDALKQEVKELKSLPLVRDTKYGIR